MTSSFLLLLLMVYYLFYYNVLHQKRKHVRQAFQTVEPFLKKYFDLHPLSALSANATAEQEAPEKLAELVAKPYETLTCEEKTELYRLYFSHCQNSGSTSGEQDKEEQPEPLPQLHKTSADSRHPFEEALRTYNQQVEKYNHAVAHFPSNIIANLLSFEKYPCLCLEESVKLWLIEAKKSPNSRLNS